MNHGDFPHLCYVRSPDGKSHEIPLNRHKITINPPFSYGFPMEGSATTSKGKLGGIVFQQDLTGRFFADLSHGDLDQFHKKSC